MQYAWHFTSIWTSLTFPTNNTQDLRRVFMSIDLTESDCSGKKKKNNWDFCFLLVLWFPRSFNFSLFSYVCLCAQCICCFYNLQSFYFDFIFHYKHTLMTRMKICLVITISVSYHMFNMFMCLLYIYFYINIYTHWPLFAFRKALRQLILHGIDIQLGALNMGTLWS